jgi:hypothetical protein
LLETQDFRQNWQRVQASNLPLALPGEGGFPASGTCVVSNKNGLLLVGTGASNNARLLIKHPKNELWQAKATPMLKGEFAGITSVQAQDSVCSITGGNLADTNSQQNIFLSFNQGHSWQATAVPPIKGAFYGSALGRWNEQWVLAVCAPQGAALSFDLGKTWQIISTKNI